MAASQVRVPIVIEKEGRTEMVYDIYSRLLKDRIVFCTGSIDDDLANTVVAQMLFLSNQDPKADIHFYINSPGGSISAGLAICTTRSSACLPDCRPSSATSRIAVKKPDSKKSPHNSSPFTSVITA